MQLLWVFPYFLVTVGCYALLVRAPLGGSSILKFLGAGSLLGVLLGVHLWFAGGEWLPAVAALAAYAFACELYLFLFTLAGTSVSVRLLLELRGGEQTRAELEEQCATAGMVEQRLDRLLRSGLLERDGKQFRATLRGRQVVALFRALKRFFRHPMVIPTPADEPWQPLPPLDVNPLASPSTRLAIDSRKNARI